MKGLAIGAVFVSLIKSIFKLLNIILTILARVLILFGLWVPLVYSFVTLILMAAFKINPLDNSYYATLFIIGLVLCFGISLIITFRNMLLKPIKELLTYRQVQKEYDKRKQEARKIDLYHRNPKKYFATYGDLPDENSQFYLKPKRKRDDITRLDEVPIIYRSSNNNDIIVHEYKDRYEVFIDKGDTIAHIDTKPR